ncbi:MAG: aminotransferase class V-fold PLP-dependent enzyme [Clostridia bacterium]|nr:aminotransferase class V-fold PLP-dependent enzyme [Clostridia bacterium]
MPNIYLDNGSTSFPKAPGVGRAMLNYIEDEGVNISRGGYQSAYSVAERVLETREQLCSLFNFKKAENVVFTSGVTASLNQIISGYLRAGDHVLTSSMEHNAVMRPLAVAQKGGAEYSCAPCAEDGSLDFEAFKAKIKANTKLVVMTHASNVCGTVMPIKEVGRFCRENGICFAVDCAQSGGILDIDMDEMCIDFLAFAGHKGLLGPQGIGGFLVRDECVGKIAPLIAGGTGSISHSIEIPEFMPDRFEAGTQNLPGIMGLNASLKFLEEIGIKKLREHELALAERFIKGIADVENVRIAGKKSAEGRTAVVSLGFENMDNAAATWHLESDFGIMTRCGLHCAPIAHQTLKTYPQGTVRFTPGFFTAEEEIDAAIHAVREISVMK